MVKGDAFGPTVKRATAAPSNQRESFSGRGVQPRNDILWDTERVNALTTRECIVGAV